MEQENTLVLDGKKLRRLREEQKLTQLYLATAVEVTTETISRWENKTCPCVKKENAQRLAANLQVPLQELLHAPPAPEEEQDIPTNYQQRWLLRSLSKRNLLWLLVTVVLITSYLLLKPAPGSLVQAQRFLPRHALPGRPFPVLIRLQESDPDHSLMIREILPPHCTLVRSQPPALNTEDANQQLKWIKSSGQDETLQYVYLVRPSPTSSEKTLHFNGIMVTGRRQNNPPRIQGERTVTLDNCHWADENCDHRIDDYEMLTVFDLFPQAQQLGLDLAEIKRIWSSHGYRWNADAHRLEFLDHPPTSAAQLVPTD